MSALSPRAMTGQPIRWGAVGLSKTALNHSAVTGWKQANGSTLAVWTAGESGIWPSGVGETGDIVFLRIARISGEEEAKEHGRTGAAIPG